MPISEQTAISLPPARLIPGRDDDLIEWYQSEKGRVVVSAYIREALRLYLAQAEKKVNFETEALAALARVEAAMLRLSMTPPDRSRPEFDDPILSKGL